MKKICLFLLINLTVSFTFASEGMIIPSLLQAFQSDMQARGMKLSADDIYSVNHSSLKDAIFQFGGGCTSEVVSSKGLLFTNYHCGYYQIQQHSSVDHDYLTDGFWAKTMADELPNAGLTALRIVRIEDVTKAVLQGCEGLNFDQLEEKIKTNCKILTNEVEKRSAYKAEVKAFDFGNSYYMMVSETFSDIRLVGAPPSFIGKFGGDTDNWVWPRHTGDFSIFRIYANKNNEPAAYNSENVPYEPLHYLPISLKAKQEGDFTMVYGFPGRTEQHASSTELQYMMEQERPTAINMREKTLEVIDAAMRSNDTTRIQYASKQSRISNAYKKWIGQVDGLRRINAVEVKQVQEKNYLDLASTKPEWSKYSSALNDIQKLFKSNEAAKFADATIIEYIFYGPEFLKFARTVESYVRQYPVWKSSGEWEKKKADLISSIHHYFGEYNVKVDQSIFNNISPIVKEKLKPEYSPASLLNHSISDLSTTIYKKSILVNEEKMVHFIEKMSEKSVKTLQKDPGYTLFDELWKIRIDPLSKSLGSFYAELEQLNRIYVEGKYVMYPNENHWADANSTLRVTYGKIEGSAPTDGMTYTNHTTIDGAIDKYYSGNIDFDLTPRYLDLYKKKDFGNYAQDGKLWVCFSGSNHTTGGNSGSPVIDGEGNLIGLNFDRSWESTMSDYMFDTTRCRNIMVDVRYLLWVIDKYAGATRLIDELELVYKPIAIMPLNFRKLEVIDKGLLKKQGN